MKRIILVLLAFMLISLSGRTANNNYFKNMMSAKIIMDTSTVKETLVAAADSFIKTAHSEPNVWLPNYYAAFCFTRISYMVKSSEERDLWVDKAQHEIDIAAEIDSVNAEILIMKAFILQAKMDINPMIRGFQFYNKTMNYFDLAIELDPENPRSYLWKGVNFYHTPDYFGGGTKKAYALIKTALEKFEAGSVQDSIAPNWGYDYALEMIEKCK
ncbi:MAG: hypothetical protein ACERKD_21455 [Prolixibacteraceae bacterium]